MVLSYTPDAARALLNPGAVFELDHDELAWIDTHYPGTLPPRPGAPTADADAAAGRTALEGRGLVAGNALSEVGRALLGQICDPTWTVVVERVTPDRRSHVWLFVVTSLGFAEQVVVSTGCCWLLGGHGQLFGRIMVDSGLMRATSLPGADGMDPVPDDRFVTTITKFVHRPVALDPVSVSFELGDAGWRDDVGPSEPRAIAARVADMLVTESVA